jgi:HAD superfamily hydrolase (TIGR01450 family)
MSYAGAIVDLDGTVYRGGEPIPGATAGIDRLRGAGADLLFFSNNPTRDGAQYAAHLREMGIEVAPEEALSAGVVTTGYLQREHAGDPVLLIGDPGLRDQLVAADVPLTDDPEAAEVLLASWTLEFDYEDMRTALAAVDEDTTFLGTDPDRTWPAGDGEHVPGSGAIIDAVAGVVGREPDAVLGKPSPEALAAARRRLDPPPADCLVVGDRLDTDLAMGELAGMTTVLVLSGSTSPADVAEASLEPDHVIDDLGEIGAVLDGD